MVRRTIILAALILSFAMAAADAAARRELTFFVASDTHFGADRLNHHTAQRLVVRTHCSTMKDVTLGAGE